jgi:Ca2+:H+ antiporter
MKNEINVHLLLWCILAPIVTCLVYAGISLNFGSWYLLFLAANLILCILAAVHLTEVFAFSVGEPLGTLVLALAIATIEVALIVSLMLSGGKDTAVLARDTIFASEMIIINGIVGGCLLIGGLKFQEQNYGLEVVSTALIVLTAISVLTLILPNYTSSIVGPEFNENQLFFVAIISVVLFASFLLMQTAKHRDYFLTENANDKDEVHEVSPSFKISIVSVILLLISLVAVVLSTKALSPSIESGIDAIGASKSVVGILIAMVVLLPEGISALNTAHKNRLQCSLNLDLGSPLANIVFTIPVVAFVSICFDMPLYLGIDIKSTVLLILALFALSLSLRTGKTTMIQ